MKRHAFTMKLKPGYEEEYKKRHDEIWPELQKVLSEAGIRNYSIYLDEATGTLFAYQELEDGFEADSSHLVVQNGGAIWRISWRRIPMILRSNIRSKKCSIWIKWTSI